MAEGRGVAVGGTVIEARRNARNARTFSWQQDAHAKVLGCLPTVTVRQYIDRH